MNSSIYRFTLDMHKVQSQISIPVMLGDTSRTLYISLTDGVIPYRIVDGCTAMLSIKRPTGTFLQEFCAIVNNEYIKYDFSQNEKTAVVEGLHNCEVTLFGGDGLQITAPKFSMVVSPRVVNKDDINISDEDQTIVDNMIAAEAARKAAELLRVTSENERIEAENQRAIAEALRTEADKKRYNSAFIRYSAYADGADFTEAWSTGQYYVGFATAFTAPTDKRAYTWCKFIGSGTADVAALTERVSRIETDLNALEDLLESI